MSRPPLPNLALLLLITSSVVALPLFSQEPDVEGRTALMTKIEEPLDAQSWEQAEQAETASSAESGVPAAVVRAELRNELPDPDDTGLAAQDNLVTLDSFGQFVETFNEYGDVPRIVLLLSPT